MKFFSLHSAPVVILIVTVVLLVLYTPTFFSDVRISESILSAPPVSHSGNIPLLLSRDFTIYTDGQYRPLSYVVLSLARTFISTKNVLFWHLWLLAFHVLNTFLVFAITRRFSSHLLIPGVAAAVFALNPICTSLVNDMNQFHLLLGTTFTLAAIQAYFSFTRGGGMSRYILSIFFFLLSLFTARVGIGIGFLFLFYGIFYERRPFLRLLLRVSIFLLLPILFLPLWSAFSPNPIHYRYATTLTPETFLFSLISVIGATGDYLGGLLFSIGYPSILYEKAEQIFTPFSGKFIFWAVFHFLLVGLTVYALWKKRWPAIGFIIVFCAMIPYTSIALNPVLDYVAWPYLYIPLFGVAFFLGGMLDVLNRINQRVLKNAGQVILAALLLFWGVQTFIINIHSRNPLSYWRYVVEQNPDSVTAACELGEAYLDEGLISGACRAFFFPGVSDVNHPCLAMAHHYLQENNPLAASIHLRYGMKSEAPGLLYENYCREFGELMMEIDALDHAEDSFGKIMMVNRFNTKAMINLARIWHRKGRASAAHRMVEEAQAIAPDDPALSLVQQEFQEREINWQENPQIKSVTPPDPEWLDYILNQEMTAGIKQKIVELCEQTDVDDPIIELEAVIVLLEKGNTDEAVTKAKSILQRLSGNSYACAVACRVFAAGGEDDIAVKTGLRAISLDVNNQMAWESLAVAYAVQDQPDTIAKEFLNAVEQRPDIGYVFYYNLGMQKRRKGEHKEAAAYLTKSLQAQPNQYEALVALGETLFDLGQIDESIEAFQNAIDINPAMDVPHGKLGGALLSLDRIPEAIKELQIAIQIEPNNALYHNNLGVCLAKQGNEEDAIKEYRRAIELNPQLEKAHFNLANSLVHLQQILPAVSEYRKTIEINPDHPHAHFNLGNALYRMGDIDDSIHEIREQIRRHPRFAQSYTFLVAVYYKMENYEKAWEVVDLARDAGVSMNPNLLDALQKTAPRQ